MRLITRSPFLLVLILTKANLLTQRSLDSNNLGDDPDMDLEGMLIEDGPNNQTSSLDSIPNLTFTSALDLQPPRPISVGAASPVTLPPASPTTLSSISNSNLSSPSLTTTTTTRAISQVVPAQTGLPPVPRNSGSQKLDLTYLHKLLGPVICLLIRFTLL